jgi:hypothetical protein
MTLCQPSDARGGPDSPYLLCGGSDSVTIAADLEHDPRRGRVLLAGELLTIAEARAFAQRLLRAADQLETILEADA